MTPVVFLRYFDGVIALQEEFGMAIHGSFHSQKAIMKAIHYPRTKLQGGDVLNWRKSSQPDIQPVFSNKALTHAKGNGFAFVARKRGT